MKHLIILASSFFVLAGPALAEDCRIPDPKPGQAIKVPDACKEAVRPKERNVQASKTKPGEIDLGHGTTLSIGGRVRGEMGWKR